jgi:hypothetical protein
MKRSKVRNPHAVVLGRLGGLVRSEAKQRANRENGQKGGLAKSPSQDTRLPAQRASSPSSPRQTVNAAISLVRERFGYFAIGLGEAGLRYGREGAINARRR